MCETCILEDQEGICKCKLCTNVRMDLDLVGVGILHMVCYRCNHITFEYVDVGD